VVETVTRIWLDVPFSEKDEARWAGARWDPTARRWYAPREGMEELARWSAAPDLPDVLPGEDRGLGEGLFVDLVPSTCWFTNVRSCVAERDWERLRRMVVRRAGGRCEVCGAAADPARGRRLEAHERWVYDESTRVQRLGRLICLCTDCHTVTHFGLATVRGLAEQARSHLMKVTGMTAELADEHISGAFSLWRERCRFEWELDLRILTDAGIGLKTPPRGGERARISRAMLRTRGHGRAAD
jgi:hypothetical protein